MERDYITAGEFEALVKKDKNPPTPEEISKAESIITDGQKEITQKRLEFLRIHLIEITEAHRKSCNDYSYLVRLKHNNIDEFKKRIEEEEGRLKEFELTLKYHQNKINEMVPILQETSKYLEEYMKD